VRKKCGTGPIEETSRRAMVPRITDIGSSRYGDAPSTAGLIVAVCGAAAGCGAGVV
jgi:hypothetical protein